MPTRRSRGFGGRGARVGPLRRPRSISASRLSDHAGSCGDRAGAAVCLGLLPRLLAPGRRQLSMVPAPQFLRVFLVISNSIAERFARASTLSDAELCAWSTSGRARTPSPWPSGAAGDFDRFGCVRRREAQLLRRLLPRPDGARCGADGASLAWLINSLAQQGRSAWRFGAARFRTKRSSWPPAIRRGPAYAPDRRPETRSRRRRRPGCVRLALEPDNGWWGRLLAEPRLAVFAALPCLALGSRSARLGRRGCGRAVGGDENLLVTDARVRRRR